MTSIEETGKTIEEATEKALDVLGVTEDQVDVEILEEGARGFLGLGQSPARVRVTVKQQPKPAPVEPAPRARPERQRTAPKPRAEKPKQEEQKPKPQPKPRKPAVPREEKPAPPAPQAIEPVKPEPLEKPEAPAPVPLTEEMLKAAAEISLEALQRIVSSIEETAKCVTKSTADNQLVLEVTSQDPATIIGKHGQTIDAIQYLVGIITNKRLPEKVRVVVDVEGYRTRREETLRAHAFDLAAQVKQSGEEAVLEPLHANERRIIHTALADNPDVYTYSEGQEPERYVVISPKK